MKSQRKSNRAKAGIIAGMERKIHNLEMRCSSLAAENHRLKKELKKYKEPKRGYDPRAIIDGAKRGFSEAPYIPELWLSIPEPWLSIPEPWLKGLGEEVEDEHTGDVQQQK